MKTINVIETDDTGLITKISSFNNDLMGAVAAERLYLNSIKSIGIDTPPDNILLDEEYFETGEGTIQLVISR